MAGSFNFENPNGVTAGSLPSGIDAAKLADASVSNAEFERLDGVTGDLQTQIDAKLAANSTKLPPTPSGAGKIIYDDGDSYEALAAGSSGQVLTSGGAGAPSWTTPSGGGLACFGDGSDGDVTISGGTTTATREMFYNNLTITGTGVLNAGGYVICVKGTLTIDVGGRLHRDGNAGSGTSGGAQLNAFQLGGGAAGGNSQNGTGFAGSSRTQAGGGNGGAGGSGGAGSGGAAGTVTAPSASRGGWRAAPVAWTGQLIGGETTAMLYGGAGGGGGAGNGTSSPGGAGGGAGAVVIVRARIAIINGSMSANGGNGAPGSATNCAGGAGGGGGVVLLTTSSLTGNQPTAAGGTGGASGGGTGNVGANGSDGNAIVLPN